MKDETGYKHKHENLSLIFHIFNGTIQNVKNELQAENVENNLHYGMVTVVNSWELKQKLSQRGVRYVFMPSVYGINKSPRHTVAEVQVPVRSTT